MHVYLEGILVRNYPQELGHEDQAFTGGKISLPSRKWVDYGKSMERKGELDHFRDQDEVHYKTKTSTKKKIILSKGVV